MLTLQERLQEESLKYAHVDPGIYQTHPDTKDRIAAAVKYMEGNDIAVNRKYALGALRTGVDVILGDLVLMVDGQPVWKGLDDERTRTLFERIASDLWEYLQLETAPYDIRVENMNGGEALLVKGKTIARSTELPEGVTSLRDLREGIQGALTSARRAHPLADYYL